MRYNQKKRIIEALETMKEGHAFISNQCCQDKTREVYGMLVDLQELALKIGQMIEEERNYLVEIINMLEAYCEEVFQCSEAVKNREDICERNEKMQRYLSDIKDKINGIETKIRIAFFPYKYSMWDSLESIWNAASEDANCECQIVPIPYYTKGRDGKFSIKHYEGEEFLKICSIVNYEEYFLEKEQPDIMYIHNPFDQYNLVTMIEPRFFSTELKKYGGILVYVPYYISGYCIKYEDLNLIASRAVVNSDYIILQSESLKKAYEYWGIPEKKLLTLGSPKVDAVINVKRNNGLSKNWETKLKGKKVILLNSSIGELLNNSNYLIELQKNISSILEKRNFALIWRPHPLLYDTIIEMRRKEKEKYEEIVKMVMVSANGVIDDNCDAKTAMWNSDAMISDYSSLLMQYTFTGQPVLVLGNSDLDCPKYIFCDYFKNYFIEEGISMEMFLDMIEKGNDRRREERIVAISSSINNSDGTCGKKIHEIICKQYREQ